MWMDEQTDMMQLTVTFCSFLNMPKNSIYVDRQNLPTKKKIYVMFFQTTDNDQRKYSDTHWTNLLVSRTKLI